MSEQSEREINTFDFLKFGKLTLTEKALKGVIFSFQRPARDKKQIGNTIAGNPGEIKVEHPIDAQLDRISRVDVNEGVLIGPVIYLWDAFVFLAMIVVFRFISNYMWSWLAWTKWFSIAILYGIYWGHDWVKRWVNFHFIFDGAPYRVLVDKSRRAELEQFVEAIKSARTAAYPSATALVPDAPRQQQVKLGMIIMSVACVIALILACCIGGCGNGRVETALEQREPYDVLKAYMKSRHCSTTFSGGVKGKFREMTKDEQKEIAKELNKLMSQNK